MSLIPDIKCARCGRTYPGVRSRCPYCGARRATRGKHAEENDNTRGKMLIGLLLVVILVVAVIILAITSSGVKDDKKPDKNNDKETTTNTDTDPETTDPAAPDAEPSSPVEPTHPEVTPAEPAPVVPAVTEDEAKITKVEITVWGNTIDDITMVIGEELDLDWSVSPDDVDTEDLKVKWESSDSSLVEITDDGVITAIAETDDPASISVTVGGKTATCIIRIHS
ncbi:MAG: hypothetical protein HUJ65_03185 [Oscillospiraceae bacterium]|nr:hypothetical protein [Oscillospiraceae bacterium]